MLREAKRRPTKGAGDLPDAAAASGSVLEATSVSRLGGGVTRAVFVKRLTARDAASPTYLLAPGRDVGREGKPVAVLLPKSAALNQAPFAPLADCPCPAGSPSAG